jgi:hypothetical protein
VRGRRGSNVVVNYAGSKDAAEEVAKMINEMDGPARAIAVKVQLPRNFPFSIRGASAAQLSLCRHAPISLSLRPLGVSTEDNPNA